MHIRLTFFRWVGSNSWRVFFGKQHVLKIYILTLTALAFPIIILHLYACVHSPPARTYPQAPTIRNFARNAEKSERLHREAAEAQAAEEASQQANMEQEERERIEGQHAGSSTADDTFVTQPGDNDMRGGRDTTRAKGTARGRGGSMAGSRPGKSTSTKKKEQMIKFAQPIIDTMPIDFREKQVSLTKYPQRIL
jgi:hypothetical protein